LNNPYFDGAASLLIGCLLTAVSLLLARESRSLLMGEGADPAVVQQIIALTEANPLVVKAPRTLTFQMGPQEIVLIQCVAFQAGLTTEAIATEIGRIRQQIQTTQPAIRHVFIEPVLAQP
jgi:divalent metal cation (Fe/Co/Zn/Cd) transporter